MNIYLIGFACTLVLILLINKITNIKKNKNNKLSKFKNKLLSKESNIDQDNNPTLKMNLQCNMA